MAENICSHIDCYNEIYNDTKECILHCEKNEFDDKYLELFWNELKYTFEINYNRYYNSVINEILIENVKFPKFQVCDGYSNNYNYNFNNSNHPFIENVKFKNCTFSDKFYLIHNRFEKELIFMDCIFYDDINIQNVNKLILENCDFKNEFKLENSTCNSLEVKNTTFHKSIDILVTDIIIIDENSIFNDKVILKGFEKLDIHCQNSEFKNEIIFSAVKNIKLIDLNLKSNIDFGENVEKLEIIDSTTGILECHNVKEFLFNNLTSPKLTSIGEKCENVFIENSTIHDINLNATNYENITIQNNTQSKEMKISDTINVVIMDSSINDIKMLGKNYTSLSIKNTDILNSLDINSIKEVTLSKIETNPKVSFQGNNYEKIIFKDLLLTSLNISQNLSLNNKIPISKELKIEDTIILNECKVSSSLNIHILDSQFNGLFRIDKCSEKLRIEESSFKNKINFEASEFNVADIANVNISGEVIFTNSKINDLTIRSNNSLGNTFSSKVNFSKSHIKKLMITFTIFEDALIFNDIDLINLSSISRNSINKLTICNTRVDDLFKDSTSLVIDTLVLDNVKLHSTDERLTIDLKNIEINDFKCNKLSISDDVNFNEMKINHFTIANSNIEKIFRIKYSEIEDTFFVDTTFEDLQIIDNKNDESSEKREFRLKNTTIKSTVLDKLKLDNFNMKDAHVSDAKIGYVKFKNGSRETNRFFKNYYDSISDYITADKYYRDEMEEQRKISKGFEKVNLLLNKGISNFGQSWIRPFGLIFGLGILFYCIFHYQILMIDGYIPNHKMIIWNNFWEFMNPFSKKATEEYENWYGLWMIHKLLTTALIYHFIIAIKRKTKR